MESSKFLAVSGTLGWRFVFLGKIGENEEGTQKTRTHRWLYQKKYGKGHMPSWHTCHSWSSVMQKHLPVWRTQDYGRRRDWTLECEDHNGSLSVYNYHQFLERSWVFTEWWPQLGRFEGITPFLTTCLHNITVHACQRTHARATTTRTARGEQRYPLRHTKPANPHRWSQAFAFAGWQASNLKLLVLPDPPQI